MLNHFYKNKTVSTITITIKGYNLVEVTDFKLSYNQYYNKTTTIINFDHDGVYDEVTR